MMTPTSATPSSGVPFIVTIDAEGDDLWSRPAEATTHNAAYVGRFQRVCGTHGMKVTYLTDYRMAGSNVFRDVVRDAVGRGQAEVGMHLHAWDTPPYAPLTNDDARYMPYLVEYPEAVMLDKIASVTKRLEETFEQPLVSHRAGRWTFDHRYAGMLVDMGYRVDCSVTPHVSWRSSRGAPLGAGGSDYTWFPETPYFVDETDVALAGNSPLLEVPMTIVSHRPSFVERLVHAGGTAMRPLQAVADRVWPSALWLRPTLTNRRSLLNIVRAAVHESRTHLQLMLHSSELMPGGSPTFRDGAAIETLYDTLEEVLGAAAPHCRGMTLAEFRAQHRETAFEPHGTR